MPSKSLAPDAFTATAASPALGQIRWEDALAQVTRSNVLQDGTDSYPWELAHASLNGLANRRLRLSTTRLDSALSSMNTQQWSQGLAHLQAARRLSLQHGAITFSAGMAITPKWEQALLFADLMHVEGIASSLVTQTSVLGAMGGFDGLWHLSLAVFRQLRGEFQPDAVSLSIMSSNFAEANE